MNACACTVNRRCLAALVMMLLTSVTIAAAAANRPAETVLRYVEQCGKNKQQVLWRLSRSDGFKLTYEKADETHVTRTDKNYETLSWSMTNSSQGSSLRAERKGDNIVVRGELKGHSVDKRIEVDGAPWYQATTLSFTRFALSDREEISFWTLRPGTAKAYKLKATKAGRETITMAGKQVEAVKIRLCLNGWLAPFWKSHYWFRASDGLFLRYEGQTDTTDDSRFTISYLAASPRI